jgi:hypothetical protein
MQAGEFGEEEEARGRTWEGGGGTRPDLGRRRRLTTGFGEEEEEARGRIWG